MFIDIQIAEEHVVLRAKAQAFSGLCHVSADRMTINFSFTTA